MAASLVNAALAGVRPAHASYYGEINDKNPVLQAINKELDEFYIYIETLNDPDYRREKNEASSRASNWLFSIWNKYSLRLPKEFYHEKLIQTGNYLSSQGTYEIALYQCFNQFLLTCHGTNLAVGTETVETCKKSYFSSGFESELSIKTCRALLGALTCQFHITQLRDPDFVRTDSLAACVDTIRRLQIFMQCIQKHESLHWMIYNCTIKMYEMCRKLMTCGHSIKAIEFLVWASMSMETSVLLLDVKFLTWRVTLYTAVCLAYYDSGADLLAENFARRSLTKLQELSELEAMSGTQDNEVTKLIFQQATVKMAAMVFKRTVFESRRRPKGLLRPKMRNNLKEAAQLVWPRTATEKLLDNMFVGSSAQFLAILEALSSSRQSCIQPSLPASESDAEILDVYAELFFAGKEIIAGGGGRGNQSASGTDYSVMAGIRSEKSLIQMAAAGEDGITLVNVIRFIKLAFAYEQWETFSALLDSALLHIKKLKSESESKGPELCLALMLLSERIIKSRASRKVLPSTSISGAGVADERLDLPTATQSSLHAVQTSDDLMNLAETVYFCISNPELFAPCGKDQTFLLDRDMVMDACKILWKKVKAVLSKLQNLGQSESNVSQKWVHLLHIIHSALIWCDVSRIDPTTLVEVSLRLALLLESTNGAEDGQEFSDISEIAQSQTQRLVSACEVLSDSINSLCAGRSLKMSFSGDDVADTMWMENAENTVTPEEALIRDLHVELLNTHHRLCLKLIKVAGKRSTVRDGTSVVTPSSSPTQVYKRKMLALVGGNLVSNALLLAQKAAVEYEDNTAAAEEALKKSVRMLYRAQEEEEKLYYLGTGDKNDTDSPSHVPPAPILLARSNTTMILKPAPFETDQAPIAWYRLFGRTSAGPNVKVRTSDYFLKGTGNEVPAGDECRFRVDGLTSNQRYVFAVAAYAADGTLIGNSIGATSEVIPAHHPTSILSAWAILAEVSHTVGVKSIAKEAAEVLWNRFVQPVLDKTAGESFVTSSSHDLQLTLYQLKERVLEESSHVLLRHLITSLFVSVDVAVQKNELFCSRVSDKGPLLPRQIIRVKECETMLVAMELSSYLNDVNYLVQAATQCFSLLASFIQSDIYFMPVVQVLIRCHAVLQEACSGPRSHRSPMVNNSVHHMIACITYYLAKVFRAWGRPETSLNIIDAGKLLLNPGDHTQHTSQKVSEVHGEPSGVNVTQGKKRGIKPANVTNTSMNHELSALEERLAELTKEKHSGDELTGGEDASTVLSYITFAKPLLAYKEISKFRRKSRYLEYFVNVMRKALYSGLIEPAIEWSQELWQWLRRRNDALSINRSLMSVENGAIVMQGNDPNKYAAVLVSYSQNVSKTKQKKKRMQRKKSHPIVKGMGDNQEELERKALAVFEKYFTEMYKNSMKRKKLRKLSADEMPWRAEFNHLLALMHFDVFMQKLEKRKGFIDSNPQSTKDMSLIDQNVWSLDNCNNIVLQPNVANKKPFNVKCNIAIEEDDDDPGQALCLAAKQAINALFDMDPTTGLNAQLSPEEDSAYGGESPRTQRTNSPQSFISTQTLDPAIAAIQNSVMKETVQIIMLSLRRALVLAHRGKLWTLLQNVSRTLLSCVNIIVEESINAVSPVMTMEDFRNISWQTVALAADFLLDMLIAMQENKSKEWPVDSYTGNVVDEKGGSNLLFDIFMDDIHKYDVPVIKAIILRSIQTLHFQGRWEQMVDICLRFSALTHDRFAETILPIMIHGQHEIAKRVLEYGGENATLQAAKNWTDEKVALNSYNYITSKLKIPPTDNNESNVDIGGFIDPGAHDVYCGGRRALALSSVPFNVDQSLENLHLSLKKSRYLSRALIHSRKLLGLYLASQHSKKEANSLPVSATGGPRENSIEFVDVESINQQAYPSVMAQTNLEGKEDVETAPFSHLPTVIESYTKTIELLASHGETDLVSQANHELGNLYLHAGNTKAALRCWCEGLDHIFGMRGATTEWIKFFETEKDIPSTMLEKFGFWGCLLSVVLSCKIGEYMSVDFQMKVSCALLAAELVQATFRTSLPHPTSCSDYLSYEIFPQYILQNSTKTTTYFPGATSIFPGVDLFADANRCEAKQLLSCLHWLCETLVQAQFNLQAFPCLTLYQYLATFVCKDLRQSVQCRCIKMNALTNIRAFKAAVNNLCVLLYGSKLPHSVDHTYRVPDSPFPHVNFNPSQSIESLENLKAMETIASKRLPESLSQLYGPHLTCEIALQQSRLLIELASCIKCIPQRPSVQDLILVLPDTGVDNTPPLTGIIGNKTPQSLKSYVSDDVRSTISAMSTTSTSFKQVKKLFSKRDTPMTIQLLKGMLLAVAEALSSSMLSPITSSGAKMTASELWVAVQSSLLLSDIEQQRQHGTIAASYALKAMKLMQTSNVFEELVTRKARPTRSALKKKGSARSTRTVAADYEKQIDNFEAMYQGRLNARLWLQVRLQLCESLQTQIAGLSKVRSAVSGDESVSNQNLLQTYCAEGLAEAETYNDPEMQAAFLLCASSVDGLSIEETIKALEDAVVTLDELSKLSDFANVALVRGTVAIADLQLQCNKWTSSHAIQEFHNAHAIMLLHMMHHGEGIIHSRSYLSTIDAPFKNIYHKNVLILAHIKLRIGLANYFTLSDTSTVDEWDATARILRQAKVLCENSAVKDPRLQAEINFELAKVLRALYFMNGCDLMEVHTHLNEAIKSSHASDSAISRNGLLEMAMLGITLNMDRSGARDKDVSLKSIDQIAKALHTAYSIAQTTQAKSILQGSSAVTSSTFSDEDKAKLPDFVLLDLSTDHTDIPNPVTVEDVATDPVVTAARIESGEFTWIHVLQYRMMLLRNFSLIRVSGEARPTTSYSDTSTLDGFYPGASKEGDQKSQAVRTPMFSTDASTRFSALHEYFQQRLPAYKETCVSSPVDSKGKYLLVQWYDVRHKRALLWCKTDSGECGKLLISNSDITRLLGQVKLLLQKVEINFGQTMGPSEKLRSRNVRQRKQSSTPQVSAQLEDDVKQTLTNCALLFSPDHDIITSVPFQITVNAVENIVELFTIGCCYTPTSPLYNWLSQILIRSTDQNS